MRGTFQGAEWAWRSELVCRARAVPPRLRNTNERKLRFEMREDPEPPALEAGPDGWRETSVCQAASDVRYTGGQKAANMSDQNASTFRQTTTPTLVNLHIVKMCATSGQCMFHTLCFDRTYDIQQQADVLLL